MAENSYAPKSPDLSSFSAEDPTRPSPPPQQPLPAPAHQQLPHQQHQLLLNTESTWSSHQQPPAPRLPLHHHQQQHHPQQPPFAPPLPQQQQLGQHQPFSHHRHSSSTGSDYRYEAPIAPSPQYPPHPHQQLPPTTAPHYAQTTSPVKSEFPAHDQQYHAALYEQQQHYHHNQHAHIAPQPHPQAQAPFGTHPPPFAQQPGQPYGHPGDPRLIPPSYAFNPQPQTQGQQHNLLPPKTEPSDMPPRKNQQAPAPPTIDPSPVRTKFPTARIKRIMQADEEVGKVAQQTPIAVGKALELFMIHVVTKSADIAREKNSKRVTAQMLKQVIATDGQYDFLADIAAKVGDEEKKSSRSASGAKAETESSEEEMEVEPKKKARGAGRKKKAT